MTTAEVRDNRGEPIADEVDGEDATPLEMGAGQVDADRAFNPGLVYDSGQTQWLQYACGIGVELTSGGASVCGAVGAVDPSDFNSPTLSVGDLAGTQTLTRTVTNVTRLPGLYKATVQAPAGFTVTVSPKLLLVPAGKSRSFQVKITRTSAPIGEWSFGSLRWRDLLGHDVRSAIAVRAAALALPDEASGTGATGSTDLSVIAGYAGTLTATGNGLAAAQVTPMALTPVEDSAFDPNAPEVLPDTGRAAHAVPAGTKLARFATYAADYPAGTDVDLFVYAQAADGSLELAGQSSGGTAEESVTLTEPGNYVAFVNLFASGGPTEVRHHFYAVPPTNAGNLTVTPASQPVTVGGTATVTAAWSGLSTGTRYLGVVDFGDGAVPLGSTVLTVTA
jgi:hypothetical protein